MRFAFAALLTAHGLAHLVGFVSSLRLADLKDLPYKTTLLGGRLDAGDAGMKVMGVLWFAAAAAFCVAAFAVAAQLPWALRFTGFVVIGSVLLCIVALPEARVGLWLNFGLAIVLMAVRKMNWTI